MYSSFTITARACMIMVSKTMYGIHLESDISYKYKDVCHSFIAEGVVK